MNLGVFGIDGNMFYLLWGDNLQSGHSYFARTIGEIRSYHQKCAGRPLLTGNNMVDILASDDKTPEDMPGFVHV